MTYASVEMRAGEGENDTAGNRGVLAGDAFPGSDEKGEVLAWQ